MPPGCNGVGQAVEWFLGTLTEADYNEIDHRIQLWIEPKYGTVFQACLNSTTGPDDVLRAVYEETRLHLDSRLGAGDFAAMFTERHHTPQGRGEGAGRVIPRGRAGMGWHGAVDGERGGGGLLPGRKRGRTAP